MKTKRNLIQGCLLCAAIILSAIAAIPCRAQTLADALDTPGWTWTSDGYGSTSGFWGAILSGSSHDGVDCAQSSMYVSCTYSSQSARLQTTVQGPAKVAFWWNYQAGMMWYVSSYGLYLNVDSQYYSAVATNLAGWSRVEVVIGPGSHNLAWNHYVNPIGTPPWCATINSSAQIDQVSATPITAPLIVQQPSSQTNYAGTTATFQALAYGSDVLTYQWLLNNTNLPAATNVSLAFTNVQPQNAGTYSLVVSNSNGSAISSNAILTVLTDPVITKQPVGQTNNAGTAATFTVSANGASPLWYLWRLNSNPVGAATTNNSYTIAAAQPGDAGFYSVIVSNAYTIAVSSNALLTVRTNPIVTQQPSSQTVNAGSPATFTVLANGPGPLWYQWQLGGNPVGIVSTNNSYTVASAQTNDAGYYSVVVSNVYATAVSSNALLTVRTIPVITTQPYALSVSEGYIASFSVGVAGPAPFQYQWAFNGTNFGGVTNNVLTLAGVKTNQAGLYSVVVSNSYGAVVSSNALLTVTPLAPTPSLGVAVNAPALVWRTSGWTAETTTTHDGVSAAYCYLPGSSSTPWMGTTVVGPGTVSFYWIVVPGFTCYGPSDGHANFFLDGAVVLGSSGTGGWVRNEVAVPPGEHTLHWNFSSMAGCGYYAYAYLDQVSFVPTTQPVIVQNDNHFGFATNSFGFNLTGSSNQVVVVEGCTNLFNPVWQSMSTNTLNTFVGTNGTSYFSDSQWTNYPGRFYRLRSP